MSTELDDLGIRYEVDPKTETVHLDGTDVTKEFNVTNVALTTPPRIQVSFTREGTGQKLVKLFKKEVQAGEQAFDDVVYVSTDTPDETTKLLKSADIRATILSAVKEGGSIEVNERHIIARIPADKTDDRALADLVRAVLKA